MLWHIDTLRSISAAWGIRRGLATYITRQTSKDRNEVRQFTIPTVEGPLYLRPRSSDWSVLMQVFVEKQYNIKSMEHFNSLNYYYNSVLREGGVPVIIDCGANIGLSAIWYSSQFPMAQIIAIEPEPDNFEILTLNVKNRYNITPIHAGVYDKLVKIDLSNKGEEPWAWEIDETENGKFDTVTINSVLISIDKGKLLIVKIDIEGSEVELFRSNREWVDSAPLVVIETHDMGFPWRGTTHSVVSVLATKPRDYLIEGENIMAFSRQILGPQ